VDLFAGTLLGDVPEMGCDYLTESGSGWVSITTLVRSLAEHGLVEEYRLMVHPVVLGHGKRLFGDDFPNTDLELSESRKVGPDVLLLLTYRPARGGQGLPTPASRPVARPAELPGERVDGAGTVDYLQ
jgi:hypothetical protein